MSYQRSGICCPPYTGGAYRVFWTGLRGWVNRTMGQQPLTGIETAILSGLAGGLQSKELARSLGRSTATVEFHVRALYEKLSARSRAQLVSRAYECGYLSVASQA